MSYEHQHVKESPGKQTSSSSGGRSYPYADYNKWMNSQLTPRITSLATALLGNPDNKRSNEWRWGKKGGFVVYVAGEKMGRFCNFESGVSGDALQLVKEQTGYRGKELSEWVKNFVGYQPKTHQAKPQEHWMPIIPVPEEALEESDVTRGLAESFMRSGMQKTARYCYRDFEGRILGYVVRFEGRGSKMTLPLTYCVNQNGTKGWWWKGFPVPRLPYGAELIKESGDTILIVEGEKTCDAARKLFPELTVVSWLAGTGSVHLTNWDCLKDKKVILWPDNDQPGFECMARLKSILEKAGAQFINVVTLPTDTPPKWDLADPLPQGWDQTTLNQIISIQ